MVYRNKYILCLCAKPKIMEVRKLPVVKCSVANCYYHMEDNLCNADAIMVDIAKHANMDFEHKIGKNQIDEEHIDYAMSKIDTLCHTFKAIN